MALHAACTAGEPSSLPAPADSLTRSSLRKHRDAAAQRLGLRSHPVLELPTPRPAELLEAAGAAAAAEQQQKREASGGAEDLLCSPEPAESPTVPAIRGSGSLSARPTLDSASSLILAPAGDEKHQVAAEAQEASASDYFCESPAVTSRHPALKQKKEVPRQQQLYARRGLAAHLRSAVCKVLGGRAGGLPLSLAPCFASMAAEDAEEDEEEAATASGYKSLSSSACSSSSSSGCFADYRNHARFQSVYHLEKKIAEGMYGKVYKCRHRSTGRRFAVKVMPICSDDCEACDRTVTEPADLERELQLMARLQGPGIVPLVEFFTQEEDTRAGGSKQQQTVAYVVMEYMRGGHLMDAHVSRGGRFSEEEARMVFRNLVHALARMHAQGVVHRDIKLENVLLDCRKGGKITADGVWLADFGLSLDLGQGGTREACGAAGTPDYVAPEVLMSEESGHGYGCQADVWSAGVLLFALLSDTLPFETDNSIGSTRSLSVVMQDKVQAIRRADSLSVLGWDESRSEAAKNLVSRCLTVDPEQRITAQEALRHPWLAEQ